MGATNRANDADKRRARVLHLAYACSPWRGSEPRVGWRRAVEASRYADVWVVCEGVEFERQIGDYLEKFGAVPGLEFRFVAKSRFEQLLAKIPGLYYPAYRLWHRRAFRVVAQLDAQVKFDLVHQSTMCGFREPGELGRLDAPWVWGPIGGTQNHPWIALGQAGLRGGIQEAIRSCANWLQLRFSPRVRRAVRRAELLLVANRTVQRDVHRAFGRLAPTMCEIGSPTVAAEAIRPRAWRSDEQRPLRLLWVGNLHAFKALPLLLRAIALLPPDGPNVALRVVGDGPQRSQWRRIARRLGVDDRIEWVGRVRDTEMQPHYTWADLFVFTSLRDTTGTVVLEALASGVPVLAADHQGVGDIVTAECGMKVDVGTPARMARQFRDALMEIAADDGRLERLSAGAVSRAAEYAWPAHGERMRDYYRQILGERFDWEPRPEIDPTERRDEPSERHDEPTGAKAEAMR